MIIVNMRGLLMSLGIFACCFLACSCQAKKDASRKFEAIQSMENSEQKHLFVEVEAPQNSYPPQKQFWDQFFKGLSASLYVIIISELGDKTFFIAAIMSMQNSRWLVYAGAMGALATMTVLSAILGYATTVVPRKWTFYTSGVLFLLFGLKMIYDAYKMSPSDAQEEYEEVKLQLSNPIDPEVGRNDSTTNETIFRINIRNSLRRFLSPVLAEAFILTFLAEWGDRSQITTIVLAATKSTSGVIVGGILGHMACTGLAVLMGRFIAQRIPVKWLTYVGGITFLFFALFTFLGDPN